MSVYKRGNVYWYNFMHGGRHYQRSAGTSDKNKALQFERTFRVKLEGARHGVKEVSEQDGNVTIKHLFDGLEKDYRIRKMLTPRNQSNLRLARAAFKGTTLALALTAAQIDAYVEKRQRGGYKIRTGKSGKRKLARPAKPATINRVTGMLRLAYKLAVKRKEIEEADIPHIRHVEIGDNARKGCFTDSEVSALRAVLPPAIADFVQFAYLSSWRKNEIATLTWDAIEGDVILLRAEFAKDREARTLPLVDSELVELIERRRKERVCDGVFVEHVFHRDGEPIKEFRKSWRSATIKAKLQGRIFHDLRRAAVKSMVDAGIAVPVAMTISGHRTFSMFKRYAIVDEAAKRKALHQRQKYNEEQRQKVVEIAQASN